MYAIYCTVKENSQMPVECRKCNIKLNQDLIVDNTSKLAVAVQNKSVVYNSMFKYGTKSNEVTNLNITNNNTTTNITNQTT